MKKKIDEIYRERFQNLETPPPIESWENILSALPQENKSKIIPLWYKLAGAAASLVLLISLYSTFLFQQSKEVTPIVSIETKKKTLYVDPVSSDFQKTMGHSAALLENMKQETLKILIENKAYATTVTQTYNNHFAGTPELEKEAIKSEISGINPDPIKYSTAGFNGSDQEVEKSNLAETKDNDNSLNQIDFIVQTDFEKENKKDIPTPERSLPKRLSIRPTAGAVYFDNFGDGNSLDARYADNNSSGEFTMAYGVHLAYKINSKWHIRTGVSKISLSHNTHNIDFGAAVLSSSLNPQEHLTPLLASSDAMNGFLNQSLEYIEIPLEVEFSLLNNKLGLNIIGGASTFLLDGNMISHNSPIAKTELGEANNLNDVSFSANIGLGLNYNFSSQFQFDLEPILKYQINTFNQGSGLNPYIFGIYSGLTFKF